MNGGSGELYRASAKADQTQQVEVHRKETTTEPFKLPLPPFILWALHWSLDLLLVALGEIEFTLRQAVEGIVCIGGTGSGKTSGPGDTFANAFLEAFFGGLVLTVKPEEAEDWKRRAAACGRPHHLFVFEPGGKWKFNLLDYIARNPNPAIRTPAYLAHVLELVLQVFNRHSGGGTNEAFWQNAVRQLVSQLARILSYSGVRMTFSDMLDFLREAPKTLRDAQLGTWRSGRVFGPRIQAALSLTEGTPEHKIVEEACEWWLYDYPTQPEDTRASVYLSFTAMVDAFKDPIIEDLFCSETTTCPEWVFAGAVIVVALPLKTYPMQGLLAAAIWKLLFQDAVGRRANLTDTDRPVFLWLDEGQYFTANLDRDLLYQSTARSAKACTVLLTQSYPGFLAAAGGSHPQHVVDGYFASLKTKIFLQSQCQATNQYMSEQLGKSKRPKISYSEPTASGFAKLFSSGGGSGPSMSVSHEWEPNVPPDTFTRLRGGGPENNFEVDAFVTLGALAVRHTGKHYIPVVFHQRHADEIDSSPPPKRRLSDVFKAAIRNIFPF